jgi:hypothetical protein
MLSCTILFLQIFHNVKGKSELCMCTLTLCPNHVFHRRVPPHTPPPGVREKPKSQHDATQGGAATGGPRSLLRPYSKVNRGRTQALPSPAVHVCPYWRKEKLQGELESRSLAEGFLSLWKMRKGKGSHKEARRDEGRSIEIHLSWERTELDARG